MKKTILFLVLAIVFGFTAEAQSVIVRNGTGCTQTFQIGAFDASCHHYVSYVLTLAPHTTQTYSVTDPGIWSATPPTTATIDAVHIMPSCTSPVNLAIPTACTPGMQTGSYTCSCGSNSIGFSVVTSTMNQLYFL